MSPVVGPKLPLVIVPAPMVPAVVLSGVAASEQALVIPRAMPATAMESPNLEENIDVLPLVTLVACHKSRRCRSRHSPDRALNVAQQGGSLSTDTTTRYIAAAAPHVFYKAAEKVSAAG